MEHADPEYRYSLSLSLEKMADPGSEASSLNRTDSAGLGVSHPVLRDKNSNIWTDFGSFVTINWVVVWRKRGKTEGRVFLSCCCRRRCCSSDSAGCCSVRWVCLLLLWKRQLTGSEGIFGTTAALWASARLATISVEVPAAAAAAAKKTKEKQTNHLLLLLTRSHCPV